MPPVTALPVQAANPFKQLVIQPQPASPPLAAVKRMPLPGLMGFCLGLLLVAGLGWLGLRALQPPVPQPAPLTAAPLKTGTVSSGFGLRNGRPHQGIDVAARPGTPIYAFKPGTVVFSGWESGYGRSVVIDHGGGLQSRYAHCAALLVRAGDAVSPGRLIARVGSTGHSTGPHLHFEILRNGRHQNPAWFIDFHRHLAYPSGEPAANGRAWPAWRQFAQARLAGWQWRPATAALSGRSFAH